MMKNILKWFAITLLLLNGLFFAANIYVIGNPAEAVVMHDDLHPETGPVVAILKVLNCFATGILYILAAIGWIRRDRKLLSLGFVAMVLFVGFYIFELISWGNTHPRVWSDFSIFGTISIILGLSTFWASRQERKKA